MDINGLYQKFYNGYKSVFGKEPSSALLFKQFLERECPDIKTTITKPPITKPHTDGRANGQLNRYKGQRTLPNLLRHFLHKKENWMDTIGNLATSVTPWYKTQEGETIAFDKLVARIVTEAGRLEETKLVEVTNREKPSAERTIRLIQPLDVPLEGLE